MYRVPTAFPSALFGAPFHIDTTRCKVRVWLEYASKTPLMVVADVTRLNFNAAFLTLESNDAILEHSQQAALFQTCL